MSVHADVRDWLCVCGSRNRMYAPVCRGCGKDQVSDIDHLRDGTALGCIGRCKLCGKAIQLRRINDHGGLGIGHSFDRWVHMGKADHSAVLNSGVCDA